MIKQALISVSDKTGVLDFSRALSALGVNILSTGGTAKLLQENGVRVTEVADYTGFPEMLDGRVKTLHPKVHGGILARRDLPEHVAKLEEHGIAQIDMVVVNLYPFQAVVAKGDCPFDEAIENIDIGGPAMLRSAAKNHKDVVVICDPADYGPVLAEMKGTGMNAGSISGDTRFMLAKKSVRPYRAIRWRHCRLPEQPRCGQGARQPRSVPANPAHDVRKGAGHALRRESAPECRVLPRPGAG